VPEWTLYFAYAAEFGCHPQDVPQIVTVAAWERWLLWRKTQYAREVWHMFRSGQAKDMTPDQQDLFNWPVGGEY